MFKTRNFRIDHYSIGVFGLDLATIILALAYLIFPGESAFWDFSGWLFLLSWIGTITLLLLVSRVRDSCTPIRKRINRLGYVTLAILGAATICMFGTSILLSVATSNAISEIGGALALHHGSFFGCAIMNSLFALIVIKQVKISPILISPSEEKIDATKRTELSFYSKFPLTHIVALLICAGAIGAMIYFAILSLAGTCLGAYAFPKVRIINGVMGLISGSFGWLFSVFTWSATVGGMNILRELRRPRSAIVVGLLGLITGSVLLSPMIAVPSMVSDTSTRFGEAYGSDWETRIPASVLPYFKSNQLVAAEYFLPLPLDDCVIIKDISFYNGSAGIDNGLQLFFDAYLPPSTDQSLPGANSTLIRIHGGGWTMGDKGRGNMPLMNRYFAAQGYCIFDVQYGLNNQSSYLSFDRGTTSANVMGNYSIDDMVRHIGIFCQYLTLHQAEYHANLNSVFVSGGSAGGHLACVTALAIASRNYTSIFGSGIAIKGFVPFYPANDMASFIDGGISTQEFYDPACMVSADSPPCLIYQGSQDRLVSPQTSQDLKDQYTDKGNPACMVIFLPFGGHGSDTNFYGYYNQFFLYYMERFLYIHR